MTSQEIFKAVNAQKMVMEEQARKLQEAKTGASKQMIVSQSLMRNQMPPQPMGQMPQQTNPQGWGRTA